MDLSLGCKDFRSEYIEEEASLSGDDVGSDENDDDDQLNIYEAEEGDNDDLPDEETIKEQLQKEWLKQQQVKATDFVFKLIS